MTSAPLRRVVRNHVVKDSLGLRPLINLDTVGSETGAVVADAVLSRTQAGQNIAAEPGDVLYAKLRPYLRKSLLVDEPVFASSEFLCLRANPSVMDPRWLFYLSRSETWAGHSQSSSYGTKMPRTSWDEMATLIVPVPTKEHQVRVANFLDGECSRIEEASQLRQEQLAALEHRSAIAADVALNERGWVQPTSLETEAVRSVPQGWRVAHLSQVLGQLTNGFVGPTRDILVDEGIPYVQGMHIKGGQIDFDRRHFFVTEAWHAARPRIHLRAGDVLIVQTGDIGRVAVVPPGFGEA